MSRKSNVNRPTENAAIGNVDKQRARRPRPARAALEALRAVLYGRRDWAGLRIVNAALAAAI